MSDIQSPASATASEEMNANSAKAAQPESRAWMQRVRTRLFKRAGEACPASGKMLQIRFISIHFKGNFKGNLKGKRREKSS